MQKIELFTPSGDRIKDMKWFLVHNHAIHEEEVSKFSDDKVERMLRSLSDRQDKIEVNKTRAYAAQDERKMEGEWRAKVVMDKKH